MNRLIISRKGFDSGRGNGGCASPVFPDGTMFSLPIPACHDPVAYGQLRHGEIDIGDVVEGLTKGRITRHHGAHFDPDINHDAYKHRRADWRGLFGQIDRSQTTLEGWEVGPGDLFLFFGWFRRVECILERWQYVRGAPDVHVLWGWLSIGDVRRVMDIEDDDPLIDLALHHPHMGYDHPPNNTLYVADGVLSAGVFPRFDERIQLTDPGDTRSHWRLPRWFHPFEPGGERPPLGYHGDASRWRSEGDDVLLATVGRGQEFVLDATAYPEAEEWALNLIESCRGT